MCKQVEGVLGEAVEMPTRCEVTMDGTTTVSDDFVTVLANEKGGHSIMYNTDAVTLGLAMKMIAVAFHQSMEQLTEEERTTVENALGGDFDLAKEPQEVTV